MYTHIPKRPVSGQALAAFTPSPSTRHAPMSRSDRAAQFAPFAALTGLEGAVAETARLTDARTQPSEQAAELLDRTLCFLREHLDEQPTVTVTYFQADKRKVGGAYLTISGIVKKLDEAARLLVFQGGEAVLLDNLLSIEGVEYSD